MSVVDLYSQIGRLLINMLDPIRTRLEVDPVEVVEEAMCHSTWLTVDLSVTSTAYKRVSSLKLDSRSVSVDECSKLMRPMSLMLRQCIPRLFAVV